MSFLSRFRSNSERAVLDSILAQLTQLTMEIKTMGTSYTQALTDLGTQVAALQGEITAAQTQAATTAQQQTALITDLDTEIKAIAAGNPAVDTTQLVALTASLKTANDTLTTGLAQVATQNTAMQAEIDKFNASQPTPTPPPATPAPVPVKPAA